MMRKSILYIATLLMLAMTSCAKNNGDIGLWFGLWHLDQIEIDGVPDQSYDGRYYFLFQNNVFCIRHVIEEEHSYLESYAKWNESDDGKILTINFIDTRFTPNFGPDVPQNHLNTITTLHVDTLNTTTMVLSYTNPDNSITYTYYLTHSE